MTPGGKLPIELLSRSAWQRVREETFAELDLGAEPDAQRANRRRRRTIVSSVLAAALAAAVVLAILAIPEAGVTPPATSRIEATNAFTRTTVGDVALEATAGSTLVTTGSEAIGWTVLVERGKVSFSVPKRGKRPRFRVQAAAVAVEVVGTRFAVERDGEDVSVEVAEGSVRVSGDGEVRVLVAGQRWESAGRAKPATADAEKPVQVDGTSLRATQAARAPSREGNVTPSRESESVSSTAPSVPASPSPRERYETASRLEATNPSKALAVYSELSRSNGPWAANALYAAGRLELEQGREERARQLLEQYAERFPNGQNIEDARKLLERFR
jgi:hypothetical protein